MKQLFFITAIWLLTGCGGKGNENAAATSDSTATATSPGAIMYFNGDIITMEGDSAQYAEAIVVKDGKIAFVGSKDEAMKNAGEGHTMVDLQGKAMFPGFIDGHAHFAGFPAQAIGAQILPPPDRCQKYS